MPDRLLPPDHNQNIARDVPPVALESLIRYAVNHVPVGSFLTAVLANDLEQALARADHVNELNLKAIVTYVYNCLPHNCHGSYQAVEEWTKTRVAT